MREFIEARPAQPLQPEESEDTQSPGAIREQTITGILETYREHPRVAREIAEWSTEGRHIGNGSATDEMGAYFAFIDQFPRLKRDRNGVDEIGPLIETIDTGLAVQEILDQYGTDSTAKQKEKLVDLTVAHQKLYFSHLGLVVSTVRRYFAAGLLTPMDLVQEGNVGLQIGISRYGEDARRYALSTHLSLWIRKYAQRAMADKGRLIRVSYGSYGRLGNIAIANDALSTQLGRTPTVAELAESVGIAESEVALLRQVDKPPHSMQKPTEDGDYGSTLEAAMGHSAETDDLIESMGMRQCIYQLFAGDSLSTREKEVLSLRLGLTEFLPAGYERIQAGGVEPRKQKDIALMLGVSTTRVKNLEKSALQKARELFAEWDVLG